MYSKIEKERTISIFFDNKGYYQQAGTYAKISSYNTKTYDHLLTILKDGNGTYFKAEYNLN